MPRKTGENALIEVEVGVTLYPMAALSTVASPSGMVGRKFLTLAEFISGQESLEPDVRLDGVISGFTLTPAATNNDVDYTAGKAYIKGTLVEVAAGTVQDIPRPIAAATNVRVSALTVDENGAINVTSGTEGAASTTRGQAGGPPFLPLDEALIGYINATYYGGSASGAAVLTTSEIDSETKERSLIPSYEVMYYDPDNSVGVILFATALPQIHAASAGGPGTARRNVYAQYSAATFEQLPEGFDFTFDEDIGTVASKSYGQEAEEKRTTTPSWTGGGSAYYTKVKDVLALIKNTIRWLKYYPDRDDADYFAGRAVFKVSREMPVEGNLMASVTLEGAGTMYDISG